MARNLDDWLRGYIEYTKHLEAPDVFHLWAAVATVAGALRGKVWVDMGYFQWKPNFFIIYVAPPGVVSKSTTVGVGMEMLREVDGIHFGPDSATWQAVTDAFIESLEEVMLPNGGKLKMSSLTIAASELGTFLDPKNREMLDILVDLWDGRRVPWKRRTKGEGESVIENPWLNFIACTTPAWIEGHFPEYAIGGGFTSRTVFVYGSAKRRLVAYPKLEMSRAGNEFKLLRGKLVKDLQQIAGLAGEYILMPEAIKWGQEWYARHWLKRPEGLESDRFGGYIARKQTHIHKLAMVIAAAQRNEMIIYARDLEVAEALISSLEEALPMVFNRISDNKGVKYTAAVIQAVRQKGERGAPRQIIWRELCSMMTYQEFEQAVAGGVASGYIVSYGDGASIVLRPQSKKKGTTGQSASEAPGAPSPAPLPAQSTSDSSSAASGSDSNALPKSAEPEQVPPS